VLNKLFEWNIKPAFSIGGYIKLENCGEKSTANYVETIKSTHFKFYLFIYSSKASISLLSLFLDF